MIGARPVRVGHIDLSFHDASAREVEKILVTHGHGIERMAAPHEVMFEMLGRREIDILVSAWLPSSHGRYVDPIDHLVRKVTVLYEPYCMWGVPEHIPQTLVAAVEDLLKPEVLERMGRRIQGINPGAGISRFSIAMIKAYGLGAAGYHFEPGSERDCFDRFEAAVASGDWVVIPLWRPQYLHARYTIRPLMESKGLLGGRDEATVLIRKDVQALIAPSATAELEALHLGNSLVSVLDDALQSRRAPT